MERGSESGVKKKSAWATFAKIVCKAAGGKWRVRVMLESCRGEAWFAIASRRQMRSTDGMLRRCSFQLLTLCCLIASLCDRAGAAQKPNFLFVIADDCTYSDLGCYGGQAITPNIDKLATQGMRFTHCFQAAPMCSPTRHNIYTGLYPVKSGAYPNHTFARDGTKSVCHYLGDLGYRVALSGKTHIGPAEVFPFEYSKADGSNPDLEAIDALMAESKAAEQPFCLFACSNEPHTPWDKGDPSQYHPEKIVLPPYFVDTPETRAGMQKYLAEITYYDRQVGQLLELLEKHEIADNTVVMVVSEQGSSMPFAKWTLYDPGIQSGAIVRWPGKVDAGSVSDAMIEYVDVLPTFLEAAGGDIPEGLDGRSFVPVLKGDTDSHKQHVYSIMTTKGIINGSDEFGIRAVRSREFKYIRNLTPDTKFTNACTQSKEFISWKAAAKAGDKKASDLVRRYHHRPAEELYAVGGEAAGDWEKTNLAEDPAYAETLAELRSKLDTWMAQQGDQGKATEAAAMEHQKSGGKKRGRKDGKAKGPKGKEKGKNVNAAQ